MQERDWWEPGDGGPRPLSADEVGGYGARLGDGELESSPRLLDCERCGKQAVDSFTEAARISWGWLVPLLCADCDAWWHR